MDMDAKVILKKLVDEFELSRDNTTERLRLQKTVYLLQAFGVHLGYGFSWYKYGPYSQELVYDAYRALYADKAEYARKAAGIDFSDGTKERFELFRSLLGQDLRDVKQLELLASVDFVQKTWLGPRPTCEKTATEFKQRKSRFYDGKDISEKAIENACQKLDAVKAALAN